MRPAHPLSGRKLVWRAASRLSPPALPSSQKREFCAFEQSSPENFVLKFESGGFFFFFETDKYLKLTGKQPQKCSCYFQTSSLSMCHQVACCCCQLLAVHDANSYCLHTCQVGILHLSVSVFTCTVPFAVSPVVPLSADWAIDELILPADSGANVNHMTQHNTLRFDVTAFSNSTHIKTRLTHGEGGGRPLDTVATQEQTAALVNPSFLMLVQAIRGPRPSLLLTTTPHVAEAARSQWGLWAALDCPLLHTVITIP